MAKAKITKMDRKSGLYLKDVGHKGRGVFCTQDIRRGEVLEVTPALVLNEKATNHVDPTILSNYTFAVDGLSALSKKKTDVKKAGDASAVVMGIASFCNHDSTRPNAEVVWEEVGGTLYYSLQATRAIPKNTEICTSYGGTWFDDRT